MRENNASNFNMNFIKQTFVCSIIGLLIFVIFSVIMTAVIMELPLLNEKLSVITYTTLGISSFISGFISASNKKIKGIICGLITGFILCAFVYILLAGISMLNFSYNAIFILPLIVGMSSLGAIIKKNI